MGVRDHSGRKSLVSWEKIDISHLKMLHV